MLVNLDAAVDVRHMDPEQGLNLVLLRTQEVLQAPDLQPSALKPGPDNRIRAPRPGDKVLAFHAPSISFYPATIDAFDPSSLQCALSLIITSGLGVRITAGL